MELNNWKKRSFQKHSIELSWDDKVVDKLSTGYNVHYGARSIKHEVEKCVVNRLAKAFEDGELPDGSKVVVNVKDGSYQLDITAPEPKKKFSLW